MGTMESLWRRDADPVPTTAGAPRAADVVIVGAGLTGLVTALLLRRAGRSVTVVDAAGPGALASGGNTGKLSLLQGSVLSRLRAHHPAGLARAYVDANREGAAWIIAFADAEGVPYTRRTAYSYAQGRAGAAIVADEAAAASDAGLAVRRGRPPAGEAVPFPLVDAIALDDQVAIDPYALVRALTVRLLAEGGAVHTGIRATGVRVFPQARVLTDAGDIAAGHIVLATGTPIVDRGLTFAKTRGLRSYAVAFAVPGEVPDGLYLSVDGPTRSLRSVTASDGPAGARLVVGGEGHPVGREPSESAAVGELVSWTRAHFPGAEPVTWWSAQDYESHNQIPFIGHLSRGGGRVSFATGYGKWGLALAPAAALRLAAEITDVPWRERSPWMRTFGTRLTVPADLARGGRENAEVARLAASGWIDAERRSAPVPRPPEGQGVVTSRGGVPVGVSTVHGRTRAVRAVCPHLGGVLTWNDADCTWDCPLHASRFTPDGTRIEGPAVTDLPTEPRRSQRRADGDRGHLRQE